MGSEVTAGVGLLKGSWRQWLYRCSRGSSWMTEASLVRLVVADGKRLWAR